MLGYRIVTHLACAGLYLAAAAFGSGAWISGATVDPRAWTRIQKEYGLCDAEVPEQDIPHEGATVKIWGAVLLALRSEWQAVSGNTPATRDVYYSGNAPYKNVPPEFALERRTISNILCSIDSTWTLTRVAVLTYGTRIIALLDELFCAEPDNARQIKLDIMDLAGRLEKYAPSEAQLWVAINKILSAAERLGAVVVSDADKESLKTLYEQEVCAYGAALKNYRTRIGIPREKKYGSNVRHDYSTHCEIMYLYDMWCAADPERSQLVLVGRDNPAPVDSLFYQYSEKGYPLPKALIISKPMCENCEKNIVRAWTSVDKDLYVVTERKPNRGEKLRHDPASRVKKIDSPLDGRESYVPTA